VAREARYLASQELRVTKGLAELVTRLRAGEAVVEDEPLILMDVEFQLREAGHDVTSVHNVDKAIEILTRQQADVVFTDIDMPGCMDGLRLGAAVRNDAASGCSRPEPLFAVSSARLPE